MMEFIDELADQIWNQPQFKLDLSVLESSNFIGGLPPQIRPFEPAQIDTVLLARLLQAASVFAATEDESQREVAQRISTAALRLNEIDNESLRSVYSVIQARLANFPALALNSHGSGAPRLAPLSLQYDFVRSRSHQTITVGDDTQHVLTRFQLESWNTLTEGKSATLTGPTSAGKSFVLLLYISERFRAKTLGNVVYVVPTRALINQVSGDFGVELARRNVNHVEITTVPVDLGNPGKSVLYVLTQERLEALLVAAPSVRFDLVVIDEAHIIAQGARGILLEAVIDRLERHESPPQLVFVGPMIKNPLYYGEIIGIPEFVECSTAQSPVTQKLIFLDYSSQPLSSVAVSIGRSAAKSSSVTITLPVRLYKDLDKLSYLSYFFGRTGSSIVYCNGKADAEKVAVNIAAQIDPDDGIASDLSELIKFVKRHVHPDYALVGALQKGVGFHYGHMPSLLRQELEHCFKTKRISYLACTSTLLYGLNLPAKNIFLSKPTTGRKTPISGADFWNLAGRVGRLGKELEGDVYLIDYDGWENLPVAQPKTIEVVSAMKSHIVENIADFSNFIDAEDTASETDPEMEIALGKLLIDFRHGRLDATLGRYRNSENGSALMHLSEKVASVSSDIGLPSEVINSNIGVSPFRQRDLLEYMLKGFNRMPPEEMIPAHPLGDFYDVLNNHRRVFKRMHNLILKYPKSDNRHNFFAPLALRWMRGDSLPILINSSIKFHKDKGENKSTASIIRGVMETIEDDLRFRYVKFFGVYNSVLKFALGEAGLGDYIESVPDIPLYLEMGGSSGVMINLMALGLSRTGAEALSEYVVDKEMALPDLRAWLARQEFAGLDLSPVILREISTVLHNGEAAI